MWQLRPPGNGTLALLGDALLVWDITGRLNVISASPHGYRELASIQVMDGGSLTHPAYSESVVYVRKRDEVAAISIRQADGLLATGEQPVQERPNLEIVSEPAGVIAGLIGDLDGEGDR